MTVLPNCRMQSITFQNMQSDTASAVVMRMPGHNPGQQGGEKMRMNLKLLRVANRLNQDEMASKLGCSRCTYAAVESGTRTGNPSFWKMVQLVFNVPDEEMYPLMKNIEE